MIYVMSDLHGQYEKYRAMLEKIRFSDRDELYILGDVVDRGPDPAAILTDMSMRSNVYPILGNHDLTAAILLRRLCAEITEENFATQLDAELLKLLAVWQMDGGQETLDSFRARTPGEREVLLEYLEEFSPCETVFVNGHQYLLVHGGIPYEKRHIPPQKQDIYDLVSVRPDYNLRYYEGITVISGHTPTLHIDPSFPGRIWRGNGHIAIDCGAAFDMPLGCLRLDDMAEFYV